MELLVDIGRGEPDFHTPDHVKQAACEAIRCNFTKYTPQPGIQELREAIVDKLAVENGVRTDAEHVVVSCGGKHSVENAIRCIVRPGDEVVMVTPYWFAYTEQVRLAGGVPVLAPAAEADGFVPSADSIRNAITAKTSLMVINSPNNPTGAVYPLPLLESIAEIAVENDLLVLADEVYEKCLYDGATHVSIASLSEDVAARTVTVNSVSKTHAMTGWRIGYAVLPGGLAQRVVAVQRVSTSAPSAISQKAALAAMTGNQSHVGEMAAAYAERRSLVLERIDRIPQLSTRRPKGAFYCFVNIGGLLGKSLRGRRIEDADAFTEALEAAAGVKVLSGVEFGSDRHVRISFAVAREALEEGFDRIEKALSDLS